MWPQLLVFVLLSFGAVVHAAESVESPVLITRGVRWPVPFREVKVDDPFWSPKLAVYIDKTIPHSWKYVQREIEDNEIAAGWKDLARGKDTPWNQANLHKVLETVSYALAIKPDAELDRKMDSIISALAAAQQPNGYCNALITVRKMTPWAHLDGQHDGYVAGHLMEAAVAHYQATGKTNFLAIARRLGEHIYDEFITRRHEGVCGHAELELALARLYRVTGDRKFLDLGQEWVERRGKPWKYDTDTERSYFMDHKPIREVDEITGHAVRSIFYLTGVADLGLETGDAGLRAAARRLWENTTLQKMYVVGSVGSQEKDEGFARNYELPNSPGYNESCASCGLANWAEAMFRLDGRAQSIDILETALYNAVLHGISLDGTNSYYRNPLTDENRPRNNVWVCCPPALSRALLRLPDYIYEQGNEDLYVNLYVGGLAKVRLKSGEFTVSQAGDYVRDGKMTITLQSREPRKFRLHLRLPAWSARTSVVLKTHDQVRREDRDGYCVLDGAWHSGDSVTLQFDAAPKRIQAHPNVSADRGLVAIRRGPLFYGIEALDNNGTADIVLAADPRLLAEYKPDLLGGVTMVTGRTAGGGEFKAVPFYALANRGNSRQVVWQKQDGFEPGDASWGGALYREYRPLP